MPLWPVFAAFAVAFVGSLLAGLAVVTAVAVARAGGHVERIAAEVQRFAASAAGLMVIALVDAVVLGVVAVVAARLSGESLRGALRLGPTRATPLGVGCAVVGMAGLSLAGGAAMDVLHVGRGQVMPALEASLHGLGAPGFLAAVLTIAVAPGVAEEAFFRGLMQTRLARRWRPSVAVVVSSLFFGVLHMDLAQGAVALLAGLFLGAVVERLGGIRPSILAHGVNNVVFVALAVFGSEQQPTGRGALAMLGAGLVVLGGAAVLLRSGRAVTT